MSFGRDSKKRIRIRLPMNIYQFSSIQFSRSVVSDSSRPHESQHARPPCPSPTPGVPLLQALNDKFPVEPGLVALDKFYFCEQVHWGIFYIRNFPVSRVKFFCKFTKRSNYDHEPVLEHFLHSNRYLCDHLQLVPISTG